MKKCENVDTWLGKIFIAPRHSNKMLRIGIDFDGVAANTPRLKTEIASQKFGIYVPMEECNKEGFIKKGFTEKTYKELQKIVYSSHDLRPVYGCLTHLRKLIEKGNDISIISFRKLDGLDIISNFLINYDLDIEKFICTDNKPKSSFCKGMNFDVFVDDRTGHLADLKKYAKNRFLFDAPYNRDEKLTDGIERVYGWKETAERIAKIR